MDELRSDIDAELRRFLSAKEQATRDGNRLIDEIARLIHAGGKRLRPAFCYWGYRTAGGLHAKQIVAASAALELLHTFAIVHDDIMDASSERRGVPTVHSRYGISVALLVGDLALVLADDLLMTAGFPPARTAEAFAHYSLMRERVILGQYLDLEVATQPFVKEQAARRVARLKSGQYSVEEPLLIGALLAGGSEELTKGLSRFGAPLGEAFQLRDDLLGSFGDARDLGKPVDSDIRRGKRNVLYAKTVTALDGAAKDFFVEHWGSGDELTEADVARLRDLVHSSGARASTERLLHDLVDEALQALEGLDINPTAEAALKELAEATARRLR
jgi:geranylgeranyl diphosphate synthase type I